MRLLDNVRLIEGNALTPLTTSAPSTRPSCSAVSLVMEESAILFHKSVIRGYHVYKRTWNPIVGEILAVYREQGNAQERHAACLLKEGAIAGHAPSEQARYFWFLIEHDRMLHLY